MPKSSFRPLKQQSLSPFSAMTISSPLPVPQQISNLSMWLDFSDSKTLYTDASLTNLVTADGNNIGSIRDKSGNGWNATVYSDSSRPYYRASQFNGKSAACFNGSTARLDIAGSQGAGSVALGTSFIPSASITLFSVVKNVGLTGRDTILNWNRGSNNLTAGSGRNGLWHLRSDLAGTPFNSRIVRTTNEEASGISSPSTSTIYLLTTISDGATGTSIYSRGVFLDGGACVLNDDQAQWAALGTRAENNGDFFQGDIAEIILYARALPAGEQARVENYLIGKYYL